MLNARRAWQRLRRRLSRDERGQILVLFVIMISVILTFAAFAIDQGYWYGQRREAQNAADAAARGGAIAIFGRPTGGACVPASPNTCAQPCREAALTAIENWMDVSNFCDDGPSETVFREVTSPCPSGARGVEAVIDFDGGAMFSRIFGIGGIDIGADATACSGTARDLRVNTTNDPAPEGIPVILADGGSRDCFNGNDLQVGHECVIWASMGDNGHNRLLWDDDEDCDGSISGTSSELTNGVGWMCEYQDDVEARYVNSFTSSSFNQRDMRNAIRARLAQGTMCDDLEGGAGPAVSFRNAFGRADGLYNVTAVPPRAFPGGSSETQAIYVWNDCFNNPRIVVVPFTNRPPNSSEDKDVDGFAVLYITGCYRSNQSMHTSAAAETETDTCQNWPDATSLERFFNTCLVSNGFCSYEIRAVPIRLFVTDGAIGGLGAIGNPNFPLTIQTVE